MEAAGVVAGLARDGRGGRGCGVFLPAFGSAGVDGTGQLFDYRGEAALQVVLSQTLGCLRQTGEHLALHVQGHLVESVFLEGLERGIVRFHIRPGIAAEARRQPIRTDCPTAAGDGVDGLQVRAAFGNLAALVEGGESFGVERFKFGGPAGLVGAGGKPEFTAALPADGVDGTRVGGQDVVDLLHAGGEALQIVTHESREDIFADPGADSDALGRGLGGEGGGAEEKDGDEGFHGDYLRSQARIVRVTRSAASC